MSDSKRRKHNSNPRSRPNSGGNSNRIPPSPMHLKKTDGNSVQKTMSHDRVREIVQEEGRAARNLIAWNVPVEDEDKGSKAKQSSSKTATLSTSRSTSRGSNKRSPQRQSFGGSDGSRPSSVNSNRGKKGDVRARYWAFLFENLKRAVDEIYQTCETDESVVGCKEVIMVLEQCTKDFRSLIERLNLLDAFEKAENRPHSIAWEVRKTSPGKAYLNTPPDRESPTVSRSLPFNQHLTTQTSTVDNTAKVQLSKQIMQKATTVPKLTVSIGNSWADKVKGAPPKSETPPTPPIPSPRPPADAVRPEAALPSPEEADGEGWETVQRPSRAKAKTSPTSKSSGNFKPPSGKTTPQRYGSKESVNSCSSTKTVTPQRYGSKESINSNSSQRSHNSSRSRPNLRNREKPKDPVTRNGATNRNSLAFNNSNSSKKNSSRVPSAPNSAKKANNATHNQSNNSVISNHQEPVKKDIEPTNDSISEDKVKDVVKDKTQLGDVDQSVIAFSEAIDNVRPGVTDTVISNVRDKLQSMLAEPASDVGQQDGPSVEEEEVDELHNALATAIAEEDQLAQQIELQQDEALLSAMQEEEIYLKEIEKEENEEIDLDSEPDTETDSELMNTASSLESSQKPLDWETLVAKYEAEASARTATNWADIVEEAETRTPGHGVHMHEKLSSPSRKKSPTEKKKNHEHKQQKAQELREKMQQEKSERLHELFKKVEEVRACKDDILQQRKDTTQRKLERAEEKRQLNLRMKVKKAHEEEMKANEIHFINTLEAQNKRHDILSKLQVSEARLQDIQEERQRKHEEKLAKEAAVEERRNALQAERTARLLEMQEKRQQKLTKIEQSFQEKEKERLEISRAKEKAKDERLAVLNAQHQAQKEELQKKIQQRQEDNAKRHTEKLLQISMKAFEMSVLKHTNEDHNDAPKMVPYETTKLCMICNALIPSEVYLLSHLRGKKHQQAIVDNNGGKALSKGELEVFNLKHIIDAPLDKTDGRLTIGKERQKALKKRCKKLRQRMITRGSDYENSINAKQPVHDSDHKAKLQKINKDLTKYLQTQGSGPWPQDKVSALDRALGEIGRIMEKKNMADQISFRLCGGLTTLCRILLISDCSTANTPSIIPNKSSVLVCNVLRLSCRNCYDNCHYVLFSNKIGSLIDILTHQLSVTIPENLDVRPSTSLSNQGGSASQKLPYDAVSTGLMQLITSILSCLAKHNPVSNSSEASAERTSSSGDAFMSRAHDIASYIISTGVVDRLTIYFSNVRSSIDDNLQAAEFLQHSMGLLVALTKLISKRNANLFVNKKIEDTTHLVETFKVTELVGIVCLLYGMLLHSSAPERGANKPPQLPQHVLVVITTGIRMLNHMATLDLKMLQSVLGEEGISLEFRHISSYLIWYCSHWTNEELHHEVILCVGYFTVLNLDNQVIIQSGQPPTVLQQLCSLPFQYFSDPRLTSILFPTLIVCCYNNQHNKKILEQELSCALLSNFIEEKQLEIQQAELTPSKKPKLTEKEKSKEIEQRMGLSARFPMDKWDVAHSYFSKE